MSNTLNAGMQKTLKALVSLLVATLLGTACGLGEPDTGSAQAAPVMIEAETGFLDISTINQTIAIPSNWFNDVDVLGPNGWQFEHTYVARDPNPLSVTGDYFIIGFYSIRNGLAPYNSVGPKHIRTDTVRRYAADGSHFDIDIYEARSNDYLTDGSTEGSQVDMVALSSTRQIGGYLVELYAQGDLYNQDVLMRVMSTSIESMTALHESDIAILLSGGLSEDTEHIGVSSVSVQTLNLGDGVSIELPVPDNWIESSAIDEQSALYTYVSTDDPDSDNVASLTVLSMNKYAFPSENELRPKLISAGFPADHSVKTDSSFKQLSANSIAIDHDPYSDPFSFYPVQSFGFTTDNRHVFVAIQSGNSARKQINNFREQIIEQLIISGPGERTLSADYSWVMDRNPDSLVYHEANEQFIVSEIDSKAISIFNAVDGTLVSRNTYHYYPRQLQLNSDGTRLFGLFTRNGGASIVNSGDRYIAEIELTTLNEISRPYTNQLFGYLHEYMVGVDDNLLVNSHGVLAVIDDGEVVQRSEQHNISGASLHRHPDRNWIVSLYSHEIKNIRFGLNEPNPDIRTDTIQRPRLERDGDSGVFVPEGNWFVTRKGLVLQTDPVSRSIELTDRALTENQVLSLLSMESTTELLTIENQKTGSRDFSASPTLGIYDKKTLQAIDKVALSIPATDLFAGKKNFYFLDHQGVDGGSRSVSVVKRGVAGELFAN